MSYTIRLAETGDAAQIREIYASIVLETAISFEVEPPSDEEMERRVAATLESYPWLVCDRGDGVLGYAYATRLRSRAAYNWSVETSVYVREGARHEGVGRRLYRSLLALLTLQGYVNVYAGIALPNDASVALHEGIGFRRLGVYRSVGYKLGRWHDVGWWQRGLRKLTAPPAPPRTLAEALALDGWRAALEDGTSDL